jgi:hypothetical protein
MPYRCFIGVDPQGLVRADRLACATRAPLIYYSLELLLSAELTSASERRLKLRERVLCDRAAFVIIQDEVRGLLLAEDNRIPPERMVFVPNAPLGPAQRRSSDYWQRRFNLPPQTRVVLHAGSLGDWTGVEDIVSGTGQWPDDWVLVVHTRNHAEASPEVQRLRAVSAPGRVFFSLNPVPRREYDALVEGADVGVAFYVYTPGSVYTQQNIQSIGLSSGKLAYFLRAGVPVVVNREATAGRLVRREGCGVAVNGGADVAEALRRIDHDYAQYSTSACRVFDEQMDFRRSFSEVLRRIDMLGAGTE